MENEPMTILTVTFEGELLEKLDVLCARSGCTREEKILEILAWSLEQDLREVFPRL